MSNKNTKYCFRLNVKTNKIKITFAMFNTESRYVSIHQGCNLTQNETLYFCRLNIQCSQQSIGSKFDLVPLCELT